MGYDHTIDGINEQIEALKVGERLVLHGVDESIYHSVTGIGSTLLKAATVSMAHYKARRDHVESWTPAQLKAFRIGTATHCLVLEPELFDSKVAIMPADIKQRRGAKWEAFEAENLGKDILTVDEETQVDAMAGSIYDGVGPYFIKGCAEVSYWYRHECGLILKARGDYVQGDALIDLKTDCVDSAHKFANKVKYDYDIQEALYREVTGLSDMLYIGVGKTKPYSIYLCRQGKAVREKAAGKIANTLSAIKLAEEFGDYPGLPIDLIETDLTEFERNKAAA